MLPKCIVLMPYYNRINNFTHNVQFCLRNNISFLPIIDYPKIDNKIHENLRAHKKALNLLRRYNITEYAVASSNSGGIFLSVNHIFTVSQSDYDYLMILEDDFLLTDSFIQFVTTCFKQNNFYLCTGQNVFTSNLPPHSYTETSLCFPFGAMVYSLPFVRDVLLSSYVTHNTPVLPEFLYKTLAKSISEQIVNLFHFYPYEYTIPTSKQIIKIYKSNNFQLGNGIAIELKLFFYNIIKKVLTYTPYTCLTPHNPTDCIINAQHLIKSASSSDNFHLIPYTQEQDVLFFKSFNNQLASHKK